MRNVGIAAGALAGLFIGNQIDHSTGARLAGAAAGAMIGGEIGDSVDKRECAVWKIAQANKVQIKVDTIKDVKGNKVGADIALGSADGEQFEVGSSQLTPGARKYFNDIASQYSYRDRKAALPENASAEDVAAVETLKDSHIMLVGHTDDTGNSHENASLSKARAREVAQIFSQHGISQDRIYFQGAGDSEPIADNNTPDGRSKNRRVEIIDVADKQQLAAVVNSKHVAPAYFSKPAEPTPVATPEVYHGIDYGGTALTASSAPMIDIGGATDTGFSLISAAHASDSNVFPPCSSSKYHASSEIESLGGKSFETADYMTMFRGNTWVTNSNNNLVELDDVKVLSDGARPVGNPTLLVYQNYYTGTAGNLKKNPNNRLAVKTTADVNVYRGSQAILYRAYPRAGFSCMDIVVPTDKKKPFQGSKLYYARGTQEYVASIDPKMVGLTQKH